MQALLVLAGATTQLVDVNGGTAPQWAEVKGQPTTAELTWQHAAPPQPATAEPAAPPDTAEPGESSPASLTVEILGSTRQGRASCRGWSSGWAREGRSTRSALLQRKTGGP